jgi:hypothetical protein
MKSKEPDSVQSLALDLFRERKKLPHLALSALQTHWGDVVGAGLAARTRPLRLARGVLWVAAPDASWAYQLQFMKTDLLRSVRAYLGSDAVADLRFKEAPSVDAAAPEPSSAPPPGLAAGPAGGPTPAPGLAPAPSPAPPGAWPVPAPVAEPLARAARSIQDEGLRAAFVRTLAKQRRSQERRNPTLPPGPGVPDEP